MTDRYAVFGNPLNHTKSPQIHARFAAECGQDMDYGTIEAPVDAFAQSLFRFIRGGAKGCNVTAPFKLEAFALATRHTETAKAAGAANTLRFDGDEIVADNTDEKGLLRDVEVNLATALRGRRVLMPGAGGAVRGAVLPFLNAGPAELALFNRTPGRAEAIRAARFGDVPGP